jgi:hypothetical protein
MTYKENPMANLSTCNADGCWCHKDKVEPMTVSWDQYGHTTVKNTPLGGFEPKESASFGTPIAAFFYDDKAGDTWDFEGTRETDPQTGGMKGKKLAELGAIDPASLMELAKVAGYGTNKYDRLNYLKGYNWSLSYDAMQRHLLTFWDGESIDPESGLHHLAHAAWHCLTLMSFDDRDLGTDDRFDPWK